MYNMEFVALRVLGSGPGPSGSPGEAVVDFEIDIKQKLVGVEGRQAGILSRHRVPVRAFSGGRWGLGCVYVPLRRSTHGHSRVSQATQDHHVGH